MKMMNGHNGPSGRFPTFNGPHSHSGSSMVSTPKSTKDSLSDSPAPAALSKSRQSSFNSHDSDSNESSTSAEGNVSGRTQPGGAHGHSHSHGHGYNGGGSHELNARGLSPHPPSSANGVTDPSSRGVSPAPQGPPQGGNAPAMLRPNVMFPHNISSFPIIKIEPPSLPHVSPVVSYSNGAPEHSTHSNATTPSSNGNGNGNGVSGQTPPSNGNGFHGINPYHTATGHPVYAWVFVPIIPNAAAPYPPSNAR